MKYKDIGERFIRYAGIFTQSEDGADTTPSSDVQRDLAEVLYEELKEMGAENVFYDKERCYVYGTIPANHEGAPVIGLMAHMDTSNAVRSTAVNPRRINDYDGGDIVLSEDLSIVLSPSEYPSLLRQKGCDIVVTDGTSVLGGDDKAGVAAIMEVADLLLKDPSVRHGEIKICFTPDEEVGNGVMNLDYDRFRCDFGYTIDGGTVGEISYENFNAAGARINIKGVSCHPGEGKGIMVNAILLAGELNSYLPQDDVPEKTEGYEGFFLLMGMNGSVDNAEMDYIIRDHDREMFLKRKEMMEKAVERLNEKYGAGTAELFMKDSYYNMREKVEPCRQIVDKAVEAMEELGIKPIVEPIRGGTDGCQISFKGIPCPNLGTGGYNFHGRYEYVSINEMKKNVELICRIINKFAEQG